MARATRKGMGPPSKGKSDGSGAMTELPEGLLEENMVLSNRDKAQHGQERGLDGRHVQTEQYQDHAGNRRDFDETGAPRDRDEGREAQIRARAYQIWQERGGGHGSADDHWLEAERDIADRGER